MKKALLLLTAGLAAAALVAPAGAATARRVTHDYTMANGAFVGHGEAHWTLGAEYAVFEAKPGERELSLEIEDASGSPVRGHVHVYYGAGEKIDKTLDFCGATPEPIALQPDTRIEVGTIMGLCDASTPSIVTEGTITATFHR